MLSIVWIILLVNIQIVISYDGSIGGILKSRYARTHKDRSVDDSEGQLLTVGRKFGRRAEDTVAFKINKYGRRKGEEHTSATPWDIMLSG